MQFETQEDLFALVKLMPEDGRIEFLSIVDLMRRGHIDHIQATQKVEDLLLKHNIIEMEEGKKHERTHHQTVLGRHDPARG